MLLKCEYTTARVIVTAKCIYENKEKTARVKRREFYTNVRQ